MMGLCPKHYGGHCISSGVSSHECSDNLKTCGNKLAIHVVFLELLERVMPKCLCIHHLKAN